MKSPTGIALNASTIIGVGSSELAANGSTIIGVNSFELPISGFTVLWIVLLLLSWVFGLSSSVKRMSLGMLVGSSSAES
jgi:hypothetical protein